MSTLCKTRWILWTICLMLLSSPIAMADAIYTFTVEGCTGDCGAGPYGTVQLTQLNSLTVKVLVTLGPNSRFAGTGAGEALVFNITPSKTVQIDTFMTGGSATTKFAQSYDTSASTFGNFGYAISCVPCKEGQAGNPAGPFSFNVWSNSGLTLADFVSNSKGYWFAADIWKNGNTGNVGALAGVTTPSADSGVPEPATFCATGAAVVMLLLARRKRPVE